MTEKFLISRRRKSIVSSNPKGRLEGLKRSRSENILNKLVAREVTFPSTSTNSSSRAKLRNFDSYSSASPLALRTLSSRKSEKHEGSFGNEERPRQRRLGAEDEEMIRRARKRAEKKKILKEKVTIDLEKLKQQEELERKLKSDARARLFDKERERRAEELSKWKETQEKKKRAKERILERKKAARAKKVEKGLKLRKAQLLAHIRKTEEQAKNSLQTKSRCEKSSSDNPVKAPDKRKKLNKKLKKLSLSKKNKLERKIPTRLKSDKDIEALARQIVKEATAKNSIGPVSPNQAEDQCNMDQSLENTSVLNVDANPTSPLHEMFQVSIDPNNSTSPVPPSFNSDAFVLSPEAYTWNVAEAKTVAEKSTVQDVEEWYRKQMEELNFNSPES